MRSKIYIGETWHLRQQPRQHEFTYPLYFLSIDLSELDSLNKKLRLFGYNRRSLFSLLDRDYIDPSEQPIRIKLQKLLAARNITIGTGVVKLITTPRFLGYTFNPVNYYVCFSESGTLQALIAEVNNTFGERHHYVLTEYEQAGNPSFIRFVFPKSFYVSPFLDVEGEYEILLNTDSDRFDIRVNISKNNRAIFSSRLSGSPVDLSSRTLISTALTFPLCAWLPMFRIHYQAFKLFCFKKISVVSKPELADPSSCKVNNGNIFIKLRYVLLSIAGAISSKQP